MNNKMKKQINSVSNWSVKSIITLTILSAVLCTFGAKANNKPSVAINAVNVETKSGTGVESGMNGIAEISDGAIEEYNAANFVEAELALESDSWMNSNSESDIEAVPYNAQEYVDADLALETESWTNCDAEIQNDVVLYNAEEYVKADLELETQGWLNNSSF